MKKRFLVIMAALSIAGAPMLGFLFQKDKPVYANASPSQVTVAASAVNVREAADSSSKIISTVYQGDAFEVIQSKNGWDQIKLSDNQSGWVSHAYVTTTEKTNATVDALVLNVRKNPSLSSQVIGQLTQGTKLTVYEEQAGWAKIDSASGVQGWVYAYYLTKDTPVGDPSPAADSGGTPSNAADPSGGQAAHSIAMDATHASDGQAAKTNTDANAADASDGQAPRADIAANAADASAQSKQPLKGKTIVLDPGHGGIDDGTTSITGTHEKDLTMATAQAVEQKLSQAGATVIMARTDDSYVTLTERADLSNHYRADAFISFHYNWSNNQAANGIMDFYYQQPKDEPLASAILHAVAETTGLQNDGAGFNDLAVLRMNSQPATLIELGFLSNTQDDSSVESPSYRDQVAQGVYQGLLNYFSVKK